MIKLKSMRPTAKEKQKIIAEAMAQHDKTKPVGEKVSYPVSFKITRPKGINLAMLFEGEITFQVTEEGLEYVRGDFSNGEGAGMHFN